MAKEAVVQGPFDVKEALDQYIKTSTEYREADGLYHPSSMWQCDRKVIYKVRGHSDEDIDEQSMRRFYIGHRLHEVLQQAIDMSPAVDAFYSEFHIRVPELGLEGHGDGLIRFKDGTWCVLEIKSIRRSGFRYGLRSENLSQAKTYGTVVRYHGVEVRSYLTGLMEYVPPLKEKMTGILVVYMEKEDLEIRQHWVPWDDLFEAEVLERIDHLDQYKNDPASLPPRLPLSSTGKKNWMCGYCPMAKKCWTEDPAHIPPNVVKLNF